MPTPLLQTAAPPDRGPVIGSLDSPDRGPASGDGTRAPDGRFGADGMTRRDFLCTASAVTACAMLAPEASGAPKSSLPTPAVSSVPAVPSRPPMPGELAVQLRVNQVDRLLNLDPRVTLLDALRENLQLSGAKKGCDHGQCGTCTVLVDGRRIYACLTLAAMNVGKDITTIEGLAPKGALHPMQAAFIEHDALQCGYCTPGQILSAVALLREPGGIADADVRKGLCGNLCRCGAYPNIVAAVQSVRGEKSAVR